MKITPGENGHLIKTGICFFIAVSAALCCYYYTSPPGDYANYYYGSFFLLQGVPVKDIYDPGMFNSLICKEGMKNVFADYAPVPPFSLLFFLPFSFMEVHLSKLLFNILSVLIFGSSLYKLFVAEKTPPIHAVLVLLICMVPLRSNMVAGQSYLLVCSFFIWGYIFSLKGNSTVASVFFALPIALKIFPVIICLWLFLTGRKKTLLLTLAFSALLFFSAIPFAGSSLYWKYSSYVLPRLLNGDINDPYAVSYQSFDVLLRKLLVYDKVLNPHVLIHSIILFRVLHILYQACIAAACIGMIRKHKKDLLMALGITFFCGMLTTGYGTSYSLLLLIFMAIGILNHSDIPIVKGIYFILLFLIAAFPAYLFSALPAFLQFPRLWLMLFLLFFLVKHDGPVFSAKTFVCLIAISALPLVALGFQKKDESVYYLEKEPSLLLTGYRSVGHGIMVYYFGRSGQDSTWYKTDVPVSSNSSLLVRNDQIFYNGRQLTDNNDQKKQASLLGDNNILYLSDRGRGVGLYGLRVIRINTNDIVRDR